MTKSAPTHRLGVRDETVGAIERATERLAAQSVARMDEDLSWFRELPAEQRSWVRLVAQSGLEGFVEWLRSDDDGLALRGGVFSAAPTAMARSVTLQQTVELVRVAIAVAEENLPGLAHDVDAATVRDELLRYSREIAFAAARVYATAAENRGSWDRRLEALVIDNLVSGTVVGDSLRSQLAALGWRDTGPIFAVVGAAPAGPADLILSAVHSRTRRFGAELMAGVHGDRLVIVVGEAGGVAEADTANAIALHLLPAFGAGPVVIGPHAPDIEQAAAVTRAALSGMRAVAAWPGAPRPVHADDLLPERTLAGDTEARAQLVREVYEPLVAAGGSLVETVAAFLDSGGALEATARALFVHANTVRYRLRRVAEVCGASAMDARGQFTLQLALVLGRLSPVT